MARKKIRQATDQRPFIMVYQDFLESDVLKTPHQKLVYIYLKKFANSKNQCFPSIKKLAALTKISARKISDVLEDLEELGVIAKENRSREDGGKTSNLYTIYDYSEMWKVENSSNEKISDIADKINEAKMIAELTAKGYVISKAKEPELAEQPTKVIANTSSTNQLNQLYIDNTITNTNNSQVRYELEDIKDIFEYDVLIHDYADQKKEIDSVMDILYDCLNTTKKTIRVSGEDKPTMVVVSRLLKLGYSEIMYCIRKFVEQKNEIKNAKLYMITLLYNAKTDMTLEINNKLNLN